MPNKDNVDSGNVTVTDSCAKNNGDLKNVAEPMQFLSSEKESTASKENHSSAPRGTLSQPCLSESASVGATSIFPHLFLGSQNDVSDEVKIEFVIVACYRRYMLLPYRRYMLLPSSWLIQIFNCSEFLTNWLT